MNKEQFFTEIPALETENYILRGVSVEDAGRLYTFMHSKETMRYITAHPVQSEAEMQDNISRYLTNFAQQKEIPWVILDKRANNLIGQFRLHKLNLWHRKAEMGAVIHEDFQKKGVMTEILGVILPFVFDCLHLNRLVGDIFAGNEGSRRLLEKFGFRKEGTLRQTDYDGQQYHDTVVYSMLEAEYRKSLE